MSGLGSQCHVEKRKDCPNLLEYKGLLEKNGQGCLIVPTFHHLLVSPILEKKGLDFKPRVWGE